MSEQDLDLLYEKYQNDPKFDYLRADHPTTFFVPGDGPLNPDIMLVGEAPGRLENAKRLPFVGRAGTNLINILTDLEIDPFHVFMTNVVKYWPQTTNSVTRTPDKDELLSHKEYLLKEIEIVNPKIVGLCGYSAITTVFPNIPNVYHSHGELLDNKFVPLYHPAYTTRPGSNKSLVVSGYSKLKEYLGDMSGNRPSSGSAIK